ncbi:DUF1223 domain-containing protein [Nonlabens antarcticus]|uniref:DUF1223 domain-containing protein n=1 Tax=Nonlabens antarcticus TaxID=392714 RepID=UPI001890B722|nr:DUF1223 domain-containing protein [Nonlabens antarcticus]
MIFNPLTRIILPIVSLILAFSVLAFQHKENHKQSNEKQLQNGVTVVELFTSQGCSSCPPADELLATIKNEQNVIALSYHVDYWNRLGWKDPYSDADFSKYQRAYAKQLNSGVYTPQMVVNGQTEFVGSRKSSLQKSLKAKSNVTALKNPKVKRTANKMSFDYEIDMNKEFNFAYALLVLEEHITNVTNGENSNRKLKNTNIVLQKVDLNKKMAKGTGEFTIPANAETGATYRVAIIMQDKNLKILAAGCSSLG